MAVETQSDYDSLDSWDSVVKRVDIVCLTDGSREDLVPLTCRYSTRVPDVVKSDSNKRPLP